MPRSASVKSSPDTEALIGSSVAVLEREKAIARSALGPPAVRDRVIEALKRRGFEVTAKFVRVPVLNQLEAALDDGGYIAIKAVGAHVHGATALEARKAALSLADAGRARLVTRTGAETLVPVSTDVLADKELAAAAKRVVELATVLQKAAKKGKGGSVLRTDVQEALDSILAQRPRVNSGAMGRSPDLARVLSAVDTARDLTVGLSFVPKVVALLAPEFVPEAAKKAILEAAARGLLELRPEGGLDRLSDLEKKACPEGPQGTHLSWARRIEVQA